MKNLKINESLIISVDFSKTSGTMPKMPIQR